MSLCRYLARADARAKKRAIDIYEIESKRLVENKNYWVLCNLASRTLLRLGEKQDFAEEDFEGNGKDFISLLDSLERLDIEGTRRGFNIRAVRTAYKKSLEYLPKIREEILDYLNDCK